MSKKKKSEQPSEPQAVESPAAPAVTETVDTDSVAATPQPPVTQTQKPGNGLALAAVVLAVAAAAGTGWLWQQGQAQQLASQSSLKAAVSQLSQQAEASRSLQQQLDKTRLELQQQIELSGGHFSSLERQLASQQKKLLSLSTTDREDWLLAEAEYLIRLANQRLLMGKEIAGAHDLLQAADDIARELDDSALFPVRQALANDMASLRAAGKLDVEGLYLQLGALTRQAEQLRLFDMPELKTEPLEVAPAENWQQRFGNGLRAAWEKLSSYIQIKRRDEVFKPLLAPEYEAAVRQNLRLMFEQAQMALLSGRQQLYQDSLNKAVDWLQNYYTLEPEQSAALVAQVQQLAGETVEVELPDISSSLRALKHYVETVHQINTVQPESVSGPEGEAL